MPESTIIMTSYNYDQYIDAAIDSVISQTHKDWELIIVDDGSQDNSLNIINEYVEKHPGKIKLFTHPGNANKGIKASYELGFSKSTGEFAAFLESDDLWEPECLEKKTSALKEFTDASLAFSGLRLLPEKNVKIKRHDNYLKYSRYVGKKCLNGPADLSKMILFRNPVISFSNIVIRSEILDDLSLIKEHEIWSDWQMVVHAAHKGNFIYIDEDLLYWRLHDKSENFEYMNVDFERKSHDFKKKLSGKYSYAQNGNNIPEYPFSFKILIYKFFHDLGYAIKHPTAAWLEIKRKLGK